MAKQNNHSLVKTVSRIADTPLGKTVQKRIRRPSPAWSLRAFNNYREWDTSVSPPTKTLHRTLYVDGLSILFGMDSDYGAFVYADDYVMRLPYPICARVKNTAGFGQYYKVDFPRCMNAPLYGLSWFRPGMFVSGTTTDARISGPIYGYQYEYYYPYFPNYARNLRYLSLGSSGERIKIVHRDCHITPRFSTCDPNKPICYIDKHATVDDGDGRTPERAIKTIQGAIEQYGYLRTYYIVGYGEDDPYREFVVTPCDKISIVGGEGFLLYGTINVNNAACFTNVNVTGPGNGIVAGVASRFTDCDISRNGGSGIISSYGTQLNNCTITYNAYDGASLSGSPGQLPTVIKNCDISHNGRYGAAITYHYLLQNSKFNNNGNTGLTQGYSSSTSMCIAENCEANNNGYYGMSFSGGTAGLVRIRNCTANYNKQHGFYATYMPPGSVRNCSADYNEIYGFLGKGYVDCTARYNKSRGFRIEGNLGVISGCIAEYNGVVAYNGGGFEGNGYADSVLRDCHARYNTGYGFQFSGNLDSCTATQNGSYGFTAGSSTAVMSWTDCIATSNSGPNGHGFYLGRGVTATRCIAEYNSQCGFTGEANTIIDCESRYNSQHGFYFWAYFNQSIPLTMQGCIAEDNTADGVYLLGRYLYGGYEHGYLFPAGSACTSCSSNSNDQYGFNTTTDVALNSCTATGNGAGNFHTPYS